ncbi:MAG: YkgJ family cysteine cluster protein [Desulfomonilaceae bacterium]
MEADFNKAEWSFFVTALKEEARDVLWKVGSTVEPETLLKSVMQDLEELGPKPESEETRTQEEIWKQVRERLLEAAYATRPYCVKCGECCSNGSPTLSIDDMNLFESRTLKPNDVFTLRKGETVFDSRLETSVPNELERIKIRETPGEKTCIFYQKWNRECSIYDERPEQCRIQECWAPNSVAYTRKSPLNRRRLFEAAGDIWKIIEKHEERCSYEDLSREISRLAATKGQTVENILEFLSFDHHVREFVSEKLGIGAETLDLLFGRPLKDSLKFYGLTLDERKDGTFVLRLIEDQE